MLSRVGRCVLTSSTYSIAVDIVIVLVARDVLHANKADIVLQEDSDQIWRAGWLAGVMRAGKNSRLSLAHHVSVFDHHLVVKTSSVPACIRMGFLRRIFECTF